MIRRQTLSTLAAVASLLGPGCFATLAAATPASIPSGLPASITGALPAIPAGVREPSATPVPSEPGAISPLPGASPAPSASPWTPDPVDLVRRAALEQLAAQTLLARRAADAGDAVAAEHAYERLLSLPAPAADKRDALVQMAVFHRERGQLAKAAAVYEKILALFPDDPANPNLYFDLGRVYRDAGLHDLAIGRFYSVLDAAISQNDGKEETRARRHLSLLARFEIAQVSYAKGDFAAAAKFYSRLQLLELPTGDRPTVAFRHAESLFQLGDFAPAAAALRGFIEEFPAGPHTPEARNLLARAFQKLGRPREATDAVLALLRREKQSTDPTDLARWQKETGRQVAAQFYEDGDFRSALTIYQTLAALDPTPGWQWPIVYEIGLCFERLNLPDRAREAYGFLQRPPGTGGDASRTHAPLLPALEAIRDMARWRQEHLAWQQGSDAQIHALLGSLQSSSADDHRLTTGSPSLQLPSSPTPKAAPTHLPGQP